jgi:hypothetical protein
MTEQERDLWGRCFELVWNQGRREAIAELLAPEAVIYDGPHRFGRSPSLLSIH